MAYELMRTESGTHAARKAVRHQLKKALDALDHGRVSSRSVHAARKDLKRARAALRLLRDALTQSTYARENAAMRDAARPLSRLRDSAVLLEQLEQLVQRYGSPGHALHLEGLRRLLRRERRQVRHAEGTPAKLRAPLVALRQLHARSARWRVGEHGWSVLGRGMQRVYGKARKAMGAAIAKRSAENLHEWRKQAKYLWHQLQLLQPLWPGQIGELADEVHRLTDYLGDDHDFAVLRAKIELRREAFPDPASRAALLALIDRCRTQLQDKAFVLGERIFREKPRSFAARFGRYWREWHGSHD
ncbi:MAG TPA: CHAD domain-containing protein [Steroidobacteraceae bacterium]|nr:CHAD domain-containing protein [Steroidobacteraceae bacterium]